MKKQYCHTIFLLLCSMYSFAQRAGIPVSNSQATLYISHPGTINNPILILGDSSSSSNNFIRFSQLNQPTYWQLGTNASFSNLQFLQSTNPVPVFNISSAGAIGINTNAPAASLHIVSPLQQSVLLNGGNGAYLSWSESGATRGFFGSYYGATQDADFGTVSSNIAGSVHLLTRGNINLTVKPDGNVGIGTTTPQQKLSVFSGLVIDAEDQTGNIFDSSNMDNKFTNMLQIGQGAYIGSDRSVNSIHRYYLDFYTNNSLRMSINEFNSVISTAEGTTTADTVKLTQGRLPQFVSNKILFGNSNADSKELFVSFGQTFSSVPVVVANVQQEPWGPVFGFRSDMFVCSILNVTTTGFTAKVSRHDPNRPGNGWGQQLQLHFTATLPIQ